MAALSVVKSGTGILTLSGESTTFDGTLQVNEGGLQLTGTFGGATSSATLASGSVLQGEGVFGGDLNLGNATIETNGITPIAILASGNLSAGTVTVAERPARLPGPIEIISYGGSLPAAALRVSPC